MNICQEMHQTVVKESLKYKEEQGRFNYVTPTSYLELLSIFSKIFGNKKNELIQSRKRTKTGLDKASAYTMVKDSQAKCQYFMRLCHFSCCKPRKK